MFNTNQIIPFDISVSQRIMPYQCPGERDQFRDDMYSDMENGLINFVFAYYKDTLLRTQHAQEWLRHRKLNHPDLIEYFSLGYADRTLGLSLPHVNRRDAGIVRGALQRTGLLKPTGHEFFHGTVVFPTKKKKNRFVGGYGRRTTPKLKAGSVYHVHWTSEDTGFFNGDALPESHQVIVTKSPVEGSTFWCAGFHNVVSTMGIHSFGQQHLEELENSGVTEVILALGNTSEGQSVSRLISQALNASGIECKIISLPKNCDVNSFAMEQDCVSTALSRLLDKARPCKQSYSHLMKVISNEK